MIPKKIYYVWFGNNPLPDEYVTYINNWKKLNPNFEIIEINENNFDIDKYDFIKTALENKKWAFASDMARLVVIYQKGGYYLDTDVQLIKPIPSFDASSVWSLENSDAINPGSFFGAEKGNSDLKNLINIYKKKKYELGKDNDFITVHIVSRYFHERGFRYKNKLQKLKNNVLILPVSYFSPLHWWGGGKINKKTIGVHMYGGSWGPDSATSLKDRLIFNSILYFPAISLGLRKIKRALKGRS